MAGPGPGGGAARPRRRGAVVDGEQGRGVPRVERPGHGGEHGRGTGGARLRRGGPAVGRLPRRPAPRRRRPPARAG
ncbi:hypothetical protein DEJ51_28565 [Streptomyces venezuelae]|uniref:Uncharacterized protein n=1 Tax=Streptomyces venezuelae TaxID=54571 RepID=A0A5P2DYE6_STRVZ|nr:hypothetical protein DEJ51_28565 [Streptomyces venezuelae]